MVIEIVDLPTENGDMVALSSSFFVNVYQRVCSMFGRSSGFGPSWPGPAPKSPVQRIQCGGRAEGARPQPTVRDLRFLGHRWRWENSP